MAKQPGDRLAAIRALMKSGSKRGGRGSARSRDTGRAKSGTSRPDIGQAFARKGGKGTKGGYGNMPEDVRNKIKTAPRAAPPPWQQSYDGKPKAPQDYEKAYDGQTAEPGAEPREQPVPQKMGQSSDAPTQRPPEAPTDIPAQSLIDELVAPRAESGGTPSESNDPETKRTPDRAPLRQRSRTPSQPTAQPRGDAIVNTPGAGPSTEDELAIVQNAINKPTTEALMELFEDPATHIKDFIGVYGEENVPDEIWSMLESPTGMPPEEYPYPGATPPSAPMPPPGTGLMDDFAPMSPPTGPRQMLPPPTPPMPGPPMPMDLMDEQAGMPDLDMFGSPMRIRY